WNDPHKIGEVRRLLFHQGVQLGNFKNWVLPNYVVDDLYTVVV
ncbi:hypothetical protein LINPERHAP1_LOCUS6381, partial [Linum perenne]